MSCMSILLFFRLHAFASAATCRLFLPPLDADDFLSEERHAAVFATPAATLRRRAARYAIYATRHYYHADVKCCYVFFDTAAYTR